MFLTGIDVIQYSKVANQNRCHVRFMVYDDAGYIYITYISSNIYIILMNIYKKIELQSMVIGYIRIIILVVH